MPGPYDHLLSQIQASPLGQSPYKQAGIDYSGQFQNTDLGDFSGQYNTPIPPDKIPAFNQWRAEMKAKTGKDPLNDRYDYDIQGDWLAGAARDQRGHGSDQFKKPNHPTFSQQSQYNGVDGYVGGNWNQDAGGNYVSYSPSHTNLTFQDAADLQNYFKKIEPNIKLDLSKVPGIKGAL